MKIEKVTDHYQIHLTPMYSDLDGDDIEFFGVIVEGKDYIDVFDSDSEVFKKYGISQKCRVRLCESTVRIDADELTVNLYGKLEDIQHVVAYEMKRVEEWRPPDHYWSEDEENEN